MAVSKPRRIFRRFLFVLLAFSFVFVGTAGYYRADRERAKTIEPILFTIDAKRLQYQALFADDDQKFKIARKLYAFTMFSSVYYEPGVKIMDQLIAAGHPEALTFRAHHLIRHRELAYKAQAVEMYRIAAMKNHAPAITALHKIYAD